MFIPQTFMHSQSEPWERMPVTAALNLNVGVLSGNKTVEIQSHTGSGGCVYFLVSGNQSPSEI